ncbi:MAG: sigma-54-dependent Fis family transcriptional regulator, partial [Marinobacter sp.]|nr:sigma-54-dependent Fis family transcriptional regulator [Marinobacter sp.]
NVIHAGDLCLELGITGRPDIHSVAPSVAATDSSILRSTEALPVDAPEPVEQSQAPFAGDAEGMGSLGDDLRQQEFRIIIQTLRKERGRRNRAAEQLGISPRTLRYKLAQMRDAGIDLDAEMAMA